MPVQPLDAMIAFDPMTYGVTITAAQLSEVFEIQIIQLIQPSADI